MASNNGSYSYQQRPSQGQGFQQTPQQGYVRPTPEYTAGTHQQRWADYPTSQSQSYEQSQHRQQQQHSQVSGLNMGTTVGAVGRSGGGGSTTPRDTPMGNVSTTTAPQRTATASPTPTHLGTSYPHYTIATHVQSYAQQPATSLADMTALVVSSAGGSTTRARTATAAQPFTGYNQYFGQDIAGEYRPGNATRVEYFNYTQEPTSSAGYDGRYQTADSPQSAPGQYGGVYQTADNNRQSTQAQAQAQAATSAAAGYAPVYQSDAARQVQTTAGGTGQAAASTAGYSPVYQAVGTARQVQAMAAQSYGAAYQTNQTVQQQPAQTQHQPSQSTGPAQNQNQPVRTVTPSQIQHQPAQAQPSRAVIPSQVQHRSSGAIALPQTQYQPQKTVTPSQTQHQSSRTVTSQARQAPQPYSASVPAQQPQQPQYENLPPTHRTPTPTIPARDNTATPPTQTQPQHTPTPLPVTKASKQPGPKPQPHTKDNPVIKFWASPASKVVGYVGGHQPQQWVSYKEQHGVLIEGNETGLEAVGVASWEQGGETRGKEEAQGQAARTPQAQQPHQSRLWREVYQPVQATQQVLASESVLQYQQAPAPDRRQSYHRQVQSPPQYPHHPPPVSEAPSPSPVTQTVPQQEPEQQYQPPAQPQPHLQYHRHQLPVSGVLMSSQGEPEPPAQPQHQQREPKPQYAPPQPGLQHQVHPGPPREPPPPPRAPSEPRPPPPLNKELMEQQMKIMVERMRYYQAADPATFQAVWDNVRKGVGPAITAGSNSGGNEGDRRAIMPAAVGRGRSMVRSESTASERTVVYTPSQAPQVQVGNVGPVNQQQQSQQEHRQAQPQSQQVEKNPVASQPVQHPQPQQAQTQHVLSQPQQQQAPVTQPPQSPNPPTDEIHLRTAQAVSKYLIKTSGHCLPEEVIVDLLHRIKSFPALCDKLESMGYKFHRGNFSRFLLAEMEVGGVEEKVEKKVEEVVMEEREVMIEVDQVVEADDGGSRVLGEVEDDQEQIMREINEARNKELHTAGSPLAEPVSAAPVEPVKRGTGGLKKSTTLANTNIDTSQPANAATVATPKTPTVSTTTQRTAFPTPTSVAPAALATPLEGPAPVAPMTTHPTPIFRPNTRSSSSSLTQPQSIVYSSLPLDQQPPSPGRDYLPRHPTPQSVKASHNVLPRNPEMKQFVSPSLVYRPPTPPSLVIDVESSPSPTPPDIYSPTTIGGTASSPLPAKSMPARGEFAPSDEEMGGCDASPANQVSGRRTSLQSAQGSQGRRPSSPKLTKIVKLRLKSLGLSSQDMSAEISSSPVAPPMNDSVQQPVVARGRTVIDLTASATPEPQMNRVAQPPASAPNPNIFYEKERQRINPPSRAVSPPPAAIPIPQTAPARSGGALPTVPPLFRSTNEAKPLKKLKYDPTTIARDIQIATGRNPQWVRPLNSHLEILRLNRRFISENADLETVRWDILDPDPVGFTVGYDAGIDDDDDGGYGDDSGFGGVDVAVARAPVMFNNPAAVKGMVDQSVAVTPTPAPRSRGRSRKGGKLGILEASVLGFENSGQGFTTTSNGSESVDGGTRRQATSTNGNGNSNGNSNSNGNGNGRTNGSSLATTGGGSWGGFLAPAPRSSSRTGSGLRNVVTPDVGGGSGNFAVVIRSPSVSSADRRRAPGSANTKGLKRKHDGSDKEKSTPAPKKPAKEKKPPAKKIEQETIDEMKPSGFKVFKCRWKFCQAELHNFETLHRHVIKAHRKLAVYGGYPCHWEGCSRSPTKEMKKAAAASRGPGNIVAPRVVWEFDTPEQWEKHVVQSHLEGVKNEIGIGPSVGPFDHEVVASDIDYLSDSFGRQVTPVARPAPRGHVFLPPPGYEFSSPNTSLSRYVQRARALGAGMEGDETADLRENDDGEGISAIVRRIVPAEDGTVGLQGVGSPSKSASGSATKEKSKRKGKGKEKAVEEKLLEDLGGGSDEAGPSNGGGIPGGGFTVYDDQEFCL